VGRLGGHGRLLPVAGAKERFGQPPPAAGHLVHQAVGEGLNGAPPGLGVGATLDPAPLGLSLRMPTPQIQVVRNGGPVGPLHRRTGSLQQQLTDRDGVAQRSSITGRTGPFG
jgi:hypothetical protein